MVSRDRLAELFLELVQIDSVSRNERMLAEYLTSRLEELGFAVYEDEAGRAIGGSAGNLVAHLPGKVDGAGSILFCAHMDTVEPGRRVKPRVKDGVVYSSGETILGADDKAGIAAILEAVRVVQEKGVKYPPIEVVFTVAEEVGLLGSKNLDTGLLKSGMGFVLDCDGSPGKIIVRAPSQDRIVARVHGRAAHAGINPEDGINAIQAASYGITCLRLGRIDDETTANIGVIRGGLATNIVPDRVDLEGETRSLVDAKRMAMTEEICRNLEEGVRRKGGRIEIAVETVYRAFKLDPDAPPVRLAMQAADQLGLKPYLEQSGGGSDANIFNAAGIPTANLACGMRKVHSTEECLELNDLVDTARLVLEIIKQSTGR